MILKCTHLYYDGFGSLYLLHVTALFYVSLKDGTVVLDQRGHDLVADILFLYTVKP